jgi:hypothetical protein
MRLASSIPGKLIPLPSSGSIPELPHVEKVASLKSLEIYRDAGAGVRKSLRFRH